MSKAVEDALAAAEPAFVQGLGAYVRVGADISAEATHQLSDTKPPEAIYTRTRYWNADTRAFVEADPKEPLLHLANAVSLSYMASRVNLVLKSDSGTITMALTPEVAGGPRMPCGRPTN